jgi:hypothetical protein
MAPWIPDRPPAAVGNDRTNRRSRFRMTRQLDLFGEGEPELPGADQTAATYRPDPDEVRAELLAVLAEVRRAQTPPWDARQALYWRTVFPQMTNWLPDEEAAELRLAFETEIRRLDAA